LEANDPIEGKKAPRFGYGDYLRFSKLIYERCGLHFPDNRRADLERGVRQAFLTSTCADMDEYYELLQDADTGFVHFERLANALTISETHFFRDAGQVDALYRHVLPSIIRRRRSLRTLRIWSAGCASGEEPYSAAMLLRELLPDVDDWSITILGTDINTQALDAARQSLYSEWAFREERAKMWRPRYFRRRGNHYELLPSVKRMVTFSKLNLVEDHYPSYESNTTLMDLILCRNVMIYFTEDISRGIVDRFYNCLTYGGWLVVGHAEHSLTIYRRFQIHNFPNAILYQRTDKARSRPQDWAWDAPRDVSGALGDASIDESEGDKPAILTPSAVTERVYSPPINLFERRDEARSEKDAPPDVSPDTQDILDLLGTEKDFEKPKAELDHVYIDSLGRLGHVDPFERAKELLNYGRSEEACELLNRMIELGRHDPSTYALLGQAYANMGDWDEAEDWCRRAIQLDKLALEAYYILALIMQHQGALEEAINFMKKVVYIDRHYVLGHFGLADLYRSYGRLPQALKSLDNARCLLEDSPDNEFIPGSGGITVGSLREAIIHQQQKWSAEAAER
jgi:chemotaxis protein methyltransferase CheR